MNAYEEIKKILAEIGGDAPFTLSVPEDKAHGDIATNIAFTLSKKLGKSPKEVAEGLVKELKEKLSLFVSDVQVAGPGFINFFLKPEAVRKEKEVVGGITTKFTGKNVLVEHSSPNLFKPFHIGHLMNNIIGEFTTRATKKGGATTITMSFPSDISLGIAKALLVILEDKKEISFFRESELSTIIAYLGEAYVRGVKECETDEEKLKKAKQILSKLYAFLDQENYVKDEYFEGIVSVTKEINEKYFKEVLESIGSHIDLFIYEGQAGDIGKLIVESALAKNKVFIKSEGAIVYDPGEERKDINTSVFINSQGYPTYEAKDLGLLSIKFDGTLDLRLIHRAKDLHFKPFDYSFFVTDAEQSQHFKVVLDAASKLGGEWSSRVEKSSHIPHGRMLFKGQKMSSRLGGVPLALDVISVVEEEVKERAGDRLTKYSQEEKNKITRDIALSALRIAVLRSKPGLNINFDPEASLSFEGDSGPYLLYTHARCFSLLEKGKEVIPSFNENAAPASLERVLFHFNEVLKESIEDVAPQKLVTYLFKVAQELNSFYASEQIISDDKEKTAHNLAIVSWAKEVLKTGLYTLGVEAVDAM